MSVTITSPSGSRATRFSLDALPGGSIKTQWDFSSDVDSNSSFMIQTTPDGSISGNVISSNLETLDIWLPPSHPFNIRTRNKLSNGTYSDWTTFQSFTSRGPLNSYEKYLVLSGISGSDNI